MGRRCGGEDADFTWVEKGVGHMEGRRKKGAQAAWMDEGPSRGLHGWMEGW
jgi:hypothetical protein